MSKLVLLDGHSLAYRAFFAMPPEMATTSGELTNATFGFTSMLLDVLEREKPDYIAVAFDVGRTWRHEHYSDYKGHRVKAPGELHPQVERIKEIVRTFNIPIFTAPGWEADDVLGTLARQAAEQGIEVLIVTGDTDAHQLVREGVRVQTSGRYFKDTRTYDPAAIEERYGLAPQQLIEYKALLGDKSDNIPGVAGIGEKTATTLLQAYETLEGIYEHLAELKPGARKRLEEGRESAFLSRKLGTIEQHVPGVDLEPEACRTRDFDRTAVFELFRELQFTSLIDRIPDPDGATPPLDLPKIETSYCLVGGEEELGALASALATAEAVALDVETDSLDSITARLVGLAVGVGDGVAYYLPVGHQVSLPEGQLRLDAPETGNAPNLALEQLRARLNPLLNRPGLKIYAHNAKFDLEVLLRHGFEVPGVHHDSMIAAWLLNPGSRAVGLKALALSELGQQMTEITELIGKKGRGQLTMDQLDVEEVTPYACADVDMTSRLVPLQVEQLKEKALYNLFHHVEMPLVRVLVDMELTGVGLDPSALTAVRKRLQDKLAELEEGIYTHAGYQFNINSPQQLSEVLFDQLGLDKRKSSRTRQGAYSTAVNVLEALKSEHPIAELILEQRSLQKLLSTYVDQLPTMVNPATGRIHTDFSQTAAETGRLSSSNPNLQNIPIRTEIGREIRRAFVAPPGHFLLAADYSQVELRVLAHLSGDEAMTESFRRGEDIHAATANRLFNVEIDGVTREQRRIAKVINFGLLYGMSAFRLARETGLEYAEAEEVLHAYFRSFPRIGAYLEGIVEQAEQTGYAETIMGRRRYFPELRQNRASNQGRAAERAAKNHPIQGSAAEIIKVAMIDIYRYLNSNGLGSRMVLQVHDELLFEVPDEELGEVAPQLVEIMSSAMELSVPLKADAKVGHNWDEMVPLEEFLE
jgi:DNA polymerase I